MELKHKKKRLLDIYDLGKGSGNAITLSEDGTYLLSNITADHTFAVIFEQDQA